MGKQITTFGAALLVAAGSALFTSAIAQTKTSTPMLVSGSAAGGHENIDALKEELAGLKAKLSNTETGRQYLVTRLEEVLAERATQEGAARDALQRIAKGRSFMSESYKKSRGKLMDARAQLADVESENAAMAAKNDRLSLQLERALRGKAYLRGRLDEAEAQLASMEKKDGQTSLALERALRGKAYLRGRLDDAEAQAATLGKKDERTSLALERALRGKAYLRGRLDDAEAQAATLGKKDERTSLALERALRGKAYLRGRLDEETSANAALDQSLANAKKGRKFISDKYLSSRAAHKEQQATNDEMSAKMQKDNDRLSLQLERALRGKAYLRGLVDELEAENGTDWADSISTALTDSFGSQSGTEVSSLSNNSVAIKVGNTGLFRPGSTSLSEGGQALLNEIGQELISQEGVQIRVVGHTDNIPTGSGSRYASNNELSLARATSALSYLINVGVPAERLSASGVGDAYPIASNDTDEGRLANRRVEMVLTPQN